MDMEKTQNITQLLAGMRQGDRDQSDELVRRVYADLRTMAARHLRHERHPLSLQPTELVDECFVRLLQGAQPQWNDRSHFFGVAAKLMRQILVDRARRRNAGKRPDNLARVPLEDICSSSETALWQVIAVDDALCKLEAVDPRLCRLIELRFFAGLDIAEAAAIVQRSTATVRRDWNFARAWLHRELS